MDERNCSMGGIVTRILHTVSDFSLPCEHTEVLTVLYLVSSGSCPFRMSTEVSKARAALASY